MATQYLTLFVLLLQIYQVTGYGSGAPLSTCFSQYPKHKGTPKQTSPSPFVVTFDPPAYRPGEDVIIQVFHNNDSDFSGIQMAARRNTGNPEEIVGRYVDHASDKTKAYNCFGGYQNMVTHARNDPVHNMSFTWRAPDENVGDVTFIATFLVSKRVFWHGVKINLPVDSTAPITAPKYPGHPLKPLTKAIDFDACGDTKGCLYYPRGCSGSDCKVVSTFKHRKSSKDFMFEVYLNSVGANYVSIGFSHDEGMGNDATVACTVGLGWMSVQEGYNPKKYNERLFNLYSSEHEIRHEDGRIHCRFVLPEKIGTYSVDQSVTDSLQYTSTEWDLMKDWYLFVAWGNTMPDSDALNYHKDRPAQSKDKVDLTENVIIYSSIFHLNIQVHATLMIVAWVLFAGIVTVISRHYRDWMVKKTMCGSDPWFQIHRTLAILVIALTLAGIIVIFVHYGTGVRDLATPHAYVGFAVVAGMGLQLIFGMFRPHLEHSLRPVFNICHRLTGHATHILAAATMFLAYEIKYISSDLRKMGITVLSVWVGVQVFWHLMFEIIKRYRSKSGGSDSYKIEGSGLKPEDSEKNSDDCPHTTTLVTYILTLIGVTAGVILPIYTY